MSTTRQEFDNIRPGPCPVVHGTPSCPPPTEIVCIDVDKVYDFCIQSDFRFECFDIPSACGTPPFPAGTTIECELGIPVCTEVPPRVPATGFPAGFFNVTVQVTVPVTITVRNPDGTVRCTFSRIVRFLKPVLLFAPLGTRIDCRIVASDCREPQVVSDPQICVKIELCIIIQSLALVKLLVPAYGFCTPAECIPAAQEEFPCPPGDLFPPQPGQVPPPPPPPPPPPCPECCASTGELVFNGGFEGSFSSGVPEGWAGTNTAQETVQQKIKTGFKAVVLGAAPNLDASLSQDITNKNLVVPGCFYKLIFTAGGSLANSSTFTGSLIFRDSSGAEIGRTNITIESQSITAGPGKVYYAKTLLAPANLNSLTVTFVKQGVGQIDLDDVSVAIV